MVIPHNTDTGEGADNLYERFWNKDCPLEHDLAGSAEAQSNHLTRSTTEDPSQ